MRKYRLLAWSCCTCGMPRLAFWPTPSSTFRSWGAGLASPPGLPRLKKAQLGFAFRELAVDRILLENLGHLVVQALGVNLPLSAGFV